MNHKAIAQMARNVKAYADELSMMAEQLLRKLECEEEKEDVLTDAMKAKLLQNRIRNHKKQLQNAIQKPD